MKIEPTTYNIHCVTSHCRLYYNDFTYINRITLYIFSVLRYDSYTGELSRENPVSKHLSLRIRVSS